MPVKESVEIRLKDWVVAFLSVGAMALICLVDYWTGVEVNIAVFYTLPVAIATWRLRPLAGILLSVLGTVAWGLVHLESEVQAYTSLIFAWNTLVHFGYLLLVVALLARLRSSYRKESERSRLDPLTGLLNVRGFQEAAGAELKRTARLAQPIGVIFMDCDDLKGVNDRHGHAAGDDLLQAIARCIRAHIREYDIAGRLGGDEFAVILPGTRLEEARNAAARIRDEVARTVEGLGPVTLSAGVAGYARPPATVDALLKRADSLLYEAKAAGKDGLRSEEVSPADR